MPTIDGKLSDTCADNFIRYKTKQKFFMASGINSNPANAGPASLCLLPDIRDQLDAKLTRVKLCSPTYRVMFLIMISVVAHNFRMGWGMSP
jgi:hypothetical protein